MNNIIAKFKQHPVLLSVIIGGLGLVVTIYFVKRSSGSQPSGTSASYTDPYGNVYDANGNMIGSLTGGTTAVPQMSSQDLSTQLADFEQSLQQQLQQWEQNQTQNTSGNSGNPGGPTSVGNPPVGDVGGWSYNPQTQQYTWSTGNAWHPAGWTPAEPPPPSGIGNPGAWSEWWNSTIGAWVGQILPQTPNLPVDIPVVPKIVNPAPATTPITPAPASNQIYAKTGVWGQGGNPFTTLWYAWTQYGQPHGENLQTYENQFMSWNPSVKNPNIIQANTSYRVW